MTAPTMTSEVTLRARALVADRASRAERLGRELGGIAQDPEAFVTALRAGLAELADDEYRAGQKGVAPGIGATFGVRSPLQTAIGRGLRSATKRDHASFLLTLADRLFDEPELEIRWLAFRLLDRTLVEEPERTWQLLRRASQEAGDWITVDSLAGPVAYGVLREPYRWAELEQLVISPSRWERRLVGSSIAVMPFERRVPDRRGAIAAHALPILALLMGDVEPEVQKALSWAYRQLLAVDRDATLAALESEVATAAHDGDGNRAWVVRDVFPKLDKPTVDRLRASLDGIRRRPAAPSTSPAAELRARFAGMGIGRPLPRPPLT